MRALVLDHAAPRGVRWDPAYPEPHATGDEVLIAVRCAGVCATDLELARGYMGFRGVPGHEFVGTVAEGPTELRGRRVVGEINCPCGQCPTCEAGHGHHCPHRTVLGIAGRDGVFAELVRLPAANCHVLPDTLSDEAAVFVEPLAAAAHVLDAYPFLTDTRVSVLGSGRLGLLTALVLQQAGHKVRVIGRNPQTLARAAAFGITMQTVADISPNPSDDVVVDCTGHPDGLRLALRLCRPLGTIVLKSTYADAAPIDLSPLVIHEHTLIGSRCGDFRRALALLADGRIDPTPLITAEFPLADGPQAFAAANSGEHVKVLLRVGAL